jgi:hypothetical protein
MLEQSNDLPAAIEHYRRAAEAGHPHGQGQFARLSLAYARVLRDAGDLDGAVTHGRAAAEAGEQYAWPTTARYLVESGRVEEVFAWLRRHADAGNVHAARELVRQAVQAHDLLLAGEALASLRAQAEAGDKTALAATPSLYLALNRPAEAFAAELWATEAGCSGGPDRLHPFELPQRIAADLERMHKYGLEPGGKVSSGWYPDQGGSGTDRPAPTAGRT